jgi:hypothetical protein
MALTVEQIGNTEDDDELVELLCDELQLWLPDELRDDRDRFHAALPALPQGLRAMAGMHFFDVSMTLDDLPWHFANQNDPRDLQETLDGLRELELSKVADLFEKAWRLMEPHFEKLRSDDINGENFYDWLEEVGLDQTFEPMNDAIWDFCEQQGDLRLLASWPRYARKFPERCVVASPFRIVS